MGGRSTEGISVCSISWRSSAGRHREVGVARLPQEPRLPVLLQAPRKVFMMPKAILPSAWTDWFLCTRLSMFTWAIAPTPSAW